MAGEYKHKYQPENTEKGIKKYLGQRNEGYHRECWFDPIQQIANQFKRLAEQDQSGPERQPCSISKDQIKPGFDRSENRKENYG